MEKQFLVNEVSLMYKRKVDNTFEPIITAARDAERIFREYIPKESIDHKEFVYLMCLSSANKVLNVAKISEGGISGCIIDIRIVMQTALLSNAVGIILCHNHPSGNLKPSTQDIKITKTVKEAGEIMDIKLLDHLIITSESYYSFADDCII